MRLCTVALVYNAEILERAETLAHFSPPSRLLDRLFADFSLCLWKLRLSTHFMSSSMLVNMTGYMGGGLHRWRARPTGGRATVG